MKVFQKIAKVCEIVDDIYCVENASFKSLDEKSFKDFLKKFDSFSFAMAQHRFYKNSPPTMSGKMQKIFLEFKDSLSLDMQRDYAENLLEIELDFKYANGVQESLSKRMSEIINNK